MTSEKEFDGDQCIVLPTNYLSSVEAATEIYEDELHEAALDLDVDNLKQTPHYIRGTLLAALIWGAPSLWTVCL